MTAGLLPVCPRDNERSQLRDFQEDAMAQKCKTPARLVEMIRWHNENIDWISEVLHVKACAALENQAMHVRDNSVEHWEGRAIGMSAMLEAALFAANCHAGFIYVGTKQLHTLADGTSARLVVQVGLDNPDFREWRRHYCVRN